jgi:hypothetical protein
MNIRRISLLAVTLCFVWLLPVAAPSKDDGSVRAGTSPGASKDSAGDANRGVDLPVFVPPKRDAPRARIGGATRGIPGALPRIEVLAPLSIGLTLEAQPDLYWHLPEKTTHRVDLTVVTDASPEPVLEVTLPPAERAGVQHVRLADHGVKLTRGVPYQWFVAVVGDAEHRGRDRIAGGAIERVDAPAELVSKLAAASADERPFVLASGGIWYDAVSDLSRRIEAAPDDTAARLQRAALLDQVGLDEVALAERASAGGGS